MHFFLFETQRLIPCNEKKLKFFLDNFFIDCNFAVLKQKIKLLKQKN